MRSAWLCLCAVLATTSAQTTCTFTSATTCSGLTPTTCSGLCDYYQALSGDSWTTKTNWGGGSDVCTWYGIVCASSVVTGINHYSNGLVGTIPATFPSFSLQELAIHDNSISGTLSTTIFSTPLKFLAVGVNPMSGTIPSTLNTATSLIGLGVWLTQISGTIPAETSTITSLKYIIGFKSKFTGHLPFTNSAQILQSVLLEDNKISGVIPEAMASIATLGELMLSHNLLSGTLPALVNTMRHVAISTNQISGTIPSSLAGSILETFEAQDNRLSGSIPWVSSASYGVTTMFAVSRNYMTGKTNALKDAVLLQTLALSSNRFSCDAVPLDSASSLGVGIYSPPIVDVLTDVTLALNTENLLGVAHADLFTISNYNNTANDNIVIVYPGNPQLTDKSSKVSQTAASNTRSKDAIMNGYISLFAGHSDLQQTLLLVLPALVFAHFATVLFFCYRASSDEASTWQNFVKYFRDSTSATLHERHYRRLDFMNVLDDFMVPGLACGGLGMILVILNAASPDVFGSGACIDPLITTTLAFPDTTPAVEWIWLILVLIILAFGTRFLVQREMQYKKRFRQTRRVIGVLDLLCNGELELAVKSWREQQQEDAWLTDWKKKYLMVLAYRCGHCLPMLVLGLPEVLYVLAQNSRRNGATGGNFFMTIFGDSTFVSIVRLTLALFVAPIAADWLAKVRFWHHPEGLRKTLLINNTAVAALVNLQFITGLSAVLTTFILDEACLRFYLNFNAHVDGLMKQWDIAMTGAAAYREGTCCRGLISIYFYIWFTTALIQMLGVPCMELLKETKEVMRLREWASDVAYWIMDCCACCCSPKKSEVSPRNPTDPNARVQLVVESEKSDTEGEGAVPEAWPRVSEEVEERENLLSREYVEEMQISTSTFYTMVMLQGVIFGLWVPLLMLAMPIICVLQLRARAWAWRYIVCSVDGDGQKCTLTAGQLASQTLLVQSPVSPVARWFFFSLFAITPWAMYDLGFHLATIIIYAFGVVLCAVYLVSSFIRINRGQLPYWGRFMVNAELETAAASNSGPTGGDEKVMPNTKKPDPEVAGVSPSIELEERYGEPPG